MKKIVLILFLILLSRPSVSDDKILEVGEELNYTVYYGFIKLGEVKFKITGKSREDKKDLYTSVASIKSFDAIPLVNINYIFESIMYFEKNEVHSVKFTATEFKEKSITNIYYTFDYDEQVIETLKEVDGNREIESKISINSKKMYQDGLSLYYSARMQSLPEKINFGKTRFNVPVYINEKESSVKYSFNSKPEPVDIDMVDFAVKCIKVAGVADFVGVFGLTGEFAGWFTDDDSRVPVKAKFNVTIGSITLELTSYKKKNWKIPAYQ
ncbi:MAG: DUF3108 domain-containing protein [Ignavibacteria bacterium]|nr:DUF3108 domain-containing protein [Ignavibacteria bacterium]